MTDAIAWLWRRRDEPVKTMAVRPRLQLFLQIAKAYAFGGGLRDDMRKEESPPEPQRILNSVVLERHQAAVMIQVRGS